MREQFSLHPTLRTWSSDTILRAISELATANTTYTSDTGKSHEFRDTGSSRAREFHPHPLTELCPFRWNAALTELNGVLVFAFILTYADALRMR